MPTIQDATPPEPVDEFDDSSLLEEIESDEPVKAADATPEPQATGDQPPVDQSPAEPWRAHLNPDETAEQAVARLAAERDERHGWATRVTSEFRGLKDELREYRGRVDPIIEAVRRAHAQRLEQERKAALPDPETDPDKAILSELHALREERRAEREQAAATAEERAEQEVDATNETFLMQKIEADPEFASAHDRIIKATHAALRRDSPSADPEQLLEVLERMDRIWLRQCATQGLDLVEETKARASEVFGWTPPAAAPAPAGEVDALRRQSERKEAARGATALGGSTSRRANAALAVDDLTEEDLVLALEKGEVGESDLLAGLVSTW